VWIPANRRSKKHRESAKGADPAMLQPVPSWGKSALRRSRNLPGSGRASLQPVINTLRFIKFIEFYGGGKIFPLRNKIALPRS
jgi:hypothetical protein